MKSTSKTTNAPKLRFPEFTDDWEIRKLGEVVERVTRKNKDLLSTLPLTISAQYGLVDQNTFFNKTVASKDVSGYYLIKNGEFAYNKSYSNGYPWGAIKRLDLYEMGVLSTLYILFKPIKINSDFLTVYYDGNVWHREIAKYAAEGARNHGLLNISTDDFFKSELTIPPTEQEQTTIGNFFRQIDGLIALHQRKLDKVKTLKKGLLQKMFPAQGETVPQIRFPQFTGDWEQRKLGDCFSERSERSSDGELISVTINLGVIKANELDRKDNSSQDKSNYKKVEIDDIAYNSMRMWQGACGVSAYSGILSPAYTVLKPRKGINSEFFAYSFKLERTLYLFKMYSQGLTSDTWNLKYPLLKDISTYAPSYEEQTTIGNFFRQFDDLISLHQRKLEHLKMLKKSLLQQMFV